jgi:hypothetical protein
MFRSSCRQLKVQVVEKVVDVPQLGSTTQGSLREVDLEESEPTRQARRTTVASGWLMLGGWGLGWLEVPWTFAQAIIKSQGFLPYTYTRTNRKNAHLATRLRSCCGRCLPGSASNFLRPGQQIFLSDIYCSICFASLLFYFVPV